MFDKTPKDQSIVEPHIVDYSVDFAVPACRWKSEGQRVYCTTCHNQHGFFLPVGQHLVGESDGQPIIEQVFDSPLQSSNG